VEVVASLSQGRTAAAQCGLFTYKSVPVIFEPPCIYESRLYQYLIVLSLPIFVQFLESCKECDLSFVWRQLCIRPTRTTFRFTWQLHI